MKTLTKLLGLIILSVLIVAYTINNKNIFKKQKPENYLILKKLSQDEYMRKRKAATYNATLYINKTNICTFIVHLPECYETNDTINLK